MTDDLILGMRNAWGKDEPFLLSARDRKQGLYLIGQSGVGKSTAMLNLMVQDVEAGRGFAFIDPHGDTAIQLLDRIPAHRVKDVVYFDPADVEFPIAFNLLKPVHRDRRHLVVSGIVGALKATWPEFFGPRMENVLAHALAALLECENVSLLGLQRMLVDAQYRAGILKRVKDPVVSAFWEREFEAVDKRTKAEIVGPVLNKIGALLLSPQVRNVLGQVKSRIDARFMMDHSRIFVANLSKGKIGPDKANLLGSLLVAEFQTAAMSRADVPESERVPFALFVDEWQSFVSESFASVLSECRKYGLSLVLANQYLTQLKPTIRDAVFGNVGSILAFRVGYEDAMILERAFGNTFRAQHFTALGNGEVYAKVLARGMEREPFVGRTFVGSPVRRTYGKAIVRRCRERFATPRQNVEVRLARWFGPRI